MKLNPALAALSLTALLATSACANPSEGKGSGAPVPTKEPAAVLVDPAIAAMVPVDIKTRGVIKVGVNPDVPPLKFTDASGKLTGVAPQLVEAAAKVMGLNAEMQITPFDALIPGITSDRIDVIASVGDFKERQAQVDFIDYLNGSTGILAAKSYKSDKATLTDLCGTRIGTLKGSLQQGLLSSASERCIADGKPAIAQAAYAAVGECILSVTSGQADGAWIDSPAVAYNVKQKPNDFKSIYTDPKSALYGIGFGKNDTQFRDALRAALLKLVETGAYKSLLESYGIGDLALPELPVNRGGPLKG